MKQMTPRQIVPEFSIYLLPPPTISEGYRYSLLGILLSNNIAV
jgi:hypothetical protein